MPFYTKDKANFKTSTGIADIKILQAIYHLQLQSKSVF